MRSTTGSCWSEAEIIQALKADGCRITRQRRAIISYLARRQDHPSAGQIFDAVRQEDPDLSLATVYNTLATLVDKGLILELDFEHVENRYDTNVVPHLNLVCSRCGDIIDMPSRPPISTQDIKDRTGFETTGIRLEYRGLCQRCHRPQGSGRTETSTPRGEGARGKGDCNEP